MFWIFKFIPDWIWLVLLIWTVIGFLSSYLPLLKPYQLLLKIISGSLVAAIIFILGMLHSERAWQQAARELEQKVLEAETKSQQVNTVVQEKLVTRTKVIREQGQEVVKYIDREVTKYDKECIIPAEFVRAHNAAAEVSK
jgi:uncharacterized SAM-binding protein YcdF (DUF218 family)